MEALTYMIDSTILIIFLTVFFRLAFFFAFEVFLLGRVKIVLALLRRVMVVLFGLANRVLVNKAIHT